MQDQDFQSFGAPAEGAAPAPARAPLPRPQGSKIAAALAKAQSEIIAPEKNKTVTVRTRDGREYSFDYADYGAIVQSIKGPLSKNEICFTHLVEEFGVRLRLVTKLIHSSGEELSSIYPLPMPNEDPKGFGGAVTYGKRYSLSAITGCVADDDVDEDPPNTQSFGPKPPKTPQAAPSAKPPASIPAQKKPSQTAPQAPASPPAADLTPPTEKQLARLFTIATTGPGAWTKEQLKEYIGLAWKIDSTKKLTRAQYDHLVGLVETLPFTQACARILSAPKA